MQNFSRRLAILPALAFATGGIALLGGALAGSSDVPYAARSLTDLPDGADLVAPAPDDLSSVTVTRDWQEVRTSGSKRGRRGRTGGPPGNPGNNNPGDNPPGNPGSNDPGNNNPGNTGNNGNGNSNTNNGNNGNGNGRTVGTDRNGAPSANTSSAPVAATGSPTTGSAPVVAGSTGVPSVATTGFPTTGSPPAGTAPASTGSSRRGVTNPDLAVAGAVLAGISNQPSVILVPGDNPDQTDTE